jgi:hypothetical protein
MNQEMQIILEVNSQAERFYEDAIQIGDHAAYALTARHRAQMTGLENVAESALKASDVLDYVKRQTARFSYWRQSFPASESSGGSDESFGERLKKYIEDPLVRMRDSICKDKLKIGDKTDEDRHTRRRVYLLLIRQFVRQVVVQYEYRVSFASTKKGENAHAVPGTATNAVRSER